jgi:hypothetical protein
MLQALGRSHARSSSTAYILILYMILQASHSSWTHVLVHAADAHGPLVLVTAELRRAFSPTTDAAVPAAAGAAAASQAGAASSQARWQVQNKVGGGSLYGVADESQTAAIVNSLEGPSHGHSHSHSHGEDASTSAISLPKAPSGSQLHQHHVSGALSSRASSSSLSAMAPAASSSAAHHHAGGGAAAGGKHQVLEGVDVVYLKNVVGTLDTMCLLLFYVP